MLTISDILEKLISTLLTLVFMVTNLKKKKKKHSLIPPVPNILCHEITKNITLFTKSTSTVKDFRLDDQKDKPLVVLMCWMMAENKHTNKFAQFWIEKGFDVLTVTIHAFQFLWPVTGTQRVAGDLLNFLDKNKSYSQIVIHGFSVGGYQWSEVLVHMTKDIDRYKPILDKIVGQIWDSIADIDEIPKGLPTAFFPKNKLVAGALHKYMLFHLKVFEKVATIHYRTASGVFHSDMVKAPRLIVCSKADPIGNVLTNQRVGNSWEKSGIQVHWKLFEDSPHVGHYRKHQKEYIAQLNIFVESLDLNHHRIETQIKKEDVNKLGF